MAAALQQIGVVHFFAGDCAMAQRMLKEATALYRDLLGVRHRAHVECLQQLAAAETGNGCSAARVNELLTQRRRLLKLVVMGEPAIP